MGDELISDESFNIELFCKEIVRLLDKKGIFVSFCSIHLLKDYFNYFENELSFRCEQIWDKRPIRTWISYTRPLRHCEYIVYFGEGNLDFRTGEIGDKYRRSQFGGSLKNTDKNTKEISEGQYEQVINFQVPPKSQEPNIISHPTRKSPQFSEYFKKILNNPERVLDPCCGSGALICSFPNAIGIDIREWNPVEPIYSVESKHKTLENFFNNI